MAFRHLLFVLVSALHYNLSQCDPCGTAKEINNIAQRVVGYKPGAGEKPICDRYLSEGWYSMGDYVIASTTEACGTDLNWHRRDNTLPTTGEITTTVCQNDPGVSNCSYPMDIKVHVCGAQYVFYLTNLDGCSEAFCIEHKDGITNISTGAPTISLTPVVKAEICSPGAPEQLCFSCDFKLQPAEMAYLFIVEWSITSGLAITKALRRSSPVKKDEHFDEETRLTEDHLKVAGYTKIGFTLACSVSAQTDIAGHASQPRTSAHKFCGFEVVNKSTVDLHTRAPKSVFVQMTIPFKCKLPNTHCDTHVELFLPKNDRCELSTLTLRETVTACFLVFNNDDVFKPKKFEITAKSGGLNDMNSYLYDLQLRTTKRNSNHKLFENYLLDPIHVSVTTDSKELNGKRCYSMNDPHMMTFEQRRYENQNGGVFVLYKNTALRQQVQIKTSNGCAGPSIFCNCGVTVSAGKDVFTVNYCGVKRYHPEIQFKRCEEGILSRKVKEAKGSSYKVYFPSGTEVEIKIDKYRVGFLNVFVDPSNLDMKKSIGLCGTLGERNIPEIGKEHEFAMKWRVNAGENLFIESNLDKLQPWPLEDKLCSCQTKDLTQAQNGIGATLATCSADHKKICKQKDWIDSNNINSCTLAKRRKRDTDYHFTQETSYDDDIQPDARSYILHKREKRATAYDETSARQACRSMLNTTAANLCSEIPTLNITSYIENCVLDTVVTNSLEWGMAHLEGFKSQCMHEVTVNQPIPAEALATVQIIQSNSSVKNSSNTNISTTTNSPSLEIDAFLSPDFLGQLEDVSCPGECSGHGKCLKGECICDDGYIDEDCSINATIPPIMTGIPDKGLCDKRSRPCLRTSVFGRNIVRSNNLACSLKGFKVNNDMKVVTSASTTVKAERITLVEVSCDLPSDKQRRSTNPINDDHVIAEGYDIAISNNGFVFSKTESILIFDSKCVSCSKTNRTFSCQLQKGYCVRNGECFSIGERSGCMMCHEVTNRGSTWISDCPDAEVPIPDANGQNKLWILGATLGPLFIFIAVVTVVYYVKVKNKKRGNKAQPFNPVNKDTTNKLSSN